MSVSSDVRDMRSQKKRSAVESPIEDPPVSASGTANSQNFKVQLSKKAKKQTKRPLMATSVDGSSESEEDMCVLSSVCVYCDGKCDETDSLSCTECEHNYHLACLGLQPAYFEVCISLTKLTGYVCVGCKVSASNKIVALTKKVNDQTAEIEKLKVKIENMANKSNSCISVATGLPQSTAVQVRNVDTDPVNVGASSYASIAAMRPTDSIQLQTIIAKTVKSINKKKLNIVVSGLREGNNESDDRAAMVDICQSYLSIDPNITRCLRVGKRAAVQGASVSSLSHNTRPRLLIVSFATETDVRAIMERAKHLRQASDPSVSNLIYFNYDISKDEAKILYEKRVERRNRMNVGADGSSANASSAAGRMGPPIQSVSGSAVRPADALNLSVNATPFQPTAGSSSNTTG
jgi:hypothetical protein